MTQVCYRPEGVVRASVLSTVKAWRMRRVWWFTATARTRARLTHLFRELLAGSL